MKQKNNAISEIIGALALIAVIAVVAAIVLVYLTSFYPPTILPDAQIEITNDSYSDPTGVNNTIHIRPAGGNVLPEQQYKIRISYLDSSGMAQSAEITPTDPTGKIIYTNLSATAGGDKTFKTGNKLDFSWPQTKVVQSVDVIYRDHKGFEVLLYQKDLLPPRPLSSSPGKFTIRVIVMGEFGTVTIEGDSLHPPDWKDYLLMQGGNISINAGDNVVDWIWDYPGLKDPSDTDSMKTPTYVVSGSGGAKQYNYNLNSINSDHTVVIQFRKPKIRVFNNGFNGYIQSSTDTIPIPPPPGTNMREYDLDPGQNLTLLFSGSDNITTINSICVSSGLIDTPSEVYASGTNISDAMGRNSYTYTIPNTTIPNPSFGIRQDYTIVGTFTGSIPTRTVRVFNLGPGGVVQYGETTVSATGTSEDITVPSFGVNPFEIVGQSGYTIKEFKVMQNLQNLTDIMSSGTTQGSAANQSIYTHQIPPDGKDYTLLVSFNNPPGTQTVRVFNEGPEGIVLSSGVTINPYSSHDFTIVQGENFNMTVNGQNGYTIRDLITLNQLANTANEVIQNGTPDSNAPDKSSYYYNTTVTSDKSIVVHFTQTQYTVRIFNEGPVGIGLVGSETINPLEVKNFTVNKSSNFSAIFNGLQGNYDIVALKNLTGLVSDPDTVMNTGNNISAAAGMHVYTYNLTNISSSYTLAVNFSAFYNVTAIAGQGGTMTKLGVTRYPAGATPQYTVSTTSQGFTMNGISGTLWNRTYQLTVDGNPIQLSSAQTRQYTYNFTPLNADHVIRARFAINGIRGNYWGWSWINQFNSAPGYAVMNRYVVYNETTQGNSIRYGPYVEGPQGHAAYNQQIHPYFRLADSKAMTDHQAGTSSGARPYYTTLETIWPNGKSPTVAQGTDKEIFYINWTGLIYLEQPGTYRFWTRADDGLKFFIDGVDAYDVNTSAHLLTSDARAWIKPNPPTWADWYACSASPGPGWHDYTVWFYENYAHAEAEIRYQLPGEASVIPSSGNVDFFYDWYYLVD